MRVSNLKDYKGGWFVGDFVPTAHRTGQFEVAFHRYEKGLAAPPHYHRHAREINLVVYGLIRVNGTVLRAEDVFVLEPYEVAEVKFLTQCELVIIKVPSVPGDKHPAEPSEEKK